MNNPERLCRSCSWKGKRADALKAPNPFDPFDVIYGCPECKEIGELRTVCDEPECWQEVVCGTPTPTGYRSTCWRHRPEH